MPKRNIPAFEFQEYFTSLSALSTVSAQHYLGRQTLGSCLSNAVSPVYILLPVLIEFLSSKIYFLICLFLCPVNLYVKKVKVQQSLSYITL